MTPRMFSFFHAKKSGAPYEDLLSLILPILTRSVTYSFVGSSSAEDSWKIDSGVA